jgi:hypothetical protein
MSFTQAIKDLMNKKPINKTNLTLDELALLWDIGFALGHIKESKEEFLSK